MKHSYPVQLAIYAKKYNIDNEPAFSWWVPYTLKKKKAILSKVESKYWDRTHKYGIQIPKSVVEAYAIDKANNNTYWSDAIKAEMPKIINSVEKLTGEIHELKGYQQILGHLIFDVKFSENFRRKVRYVADGHRTKTPTSITYSTVVALDSVRIFLTIVALNELDILSADV